MARQLTVRAITCRSMIATLLSLLSLLSLLFATACTTAAIAGDWTNSGGNAGRNGLSTDIGPGDADLLWSGGRSSIIAWQPVTEGNRVFMVRQYDWPAQGPNDAWVVAMDLETGAELWAAQMPFETGDWTPWIAGVQDGKLFASRAGNGASISARMYALDVVDGQTVWISADEIDAGAYDGVVFAPNGDLLVASFRDVWRIDIDDGTTVWQASRTGSVSGTCGGALGGVAGDAFYVADVAPGGNIIVRFDVATGARMYESPVMPGFTIQNTPMVGPDGAVYLNRAQNNVAVDFYYCFTDTGAALVERWNIPGMGGAAAEFGIGPDGSVYFITPGPRLARLEPITGTVLAETDALAGFSKARIAVDATGRVFLSNGAFASGRLYTYESDLTPIWDVGVTNINIGGPAIGQGGILVVCGIGADVRAYRTTSSGIAGAAAGASPVAQLWSAPNPCRTQTAIHFTLARQAAVTLAVYDVHGRRVRTLLSASSQGAGEHAIEWRGRSDTGESLPSGTYFYRLSGGGRVAAGRTLLLH